jgi:hypothetical protein
MGRVRAIAATAVLLSIGGTASAGGSAFDLPAFTATPRLWTRFDTADTFAQPQVARRSAAMTDPRFELYRATVRLGTTIATACAKHAGKSELAFARVELDDTGHIKSKVQLLEPNATRALKQCIDRELGAATLPVVPGQSKATVRFDFDRTGM